MKKMAALFIFSSMWLALAPNAAGDGISQPVSHGVFGGLGIKVEVKEGQLTVVSVIEGTTAEKVGLKEGDIISKINGKGTKGLAIEKAVLRLRGKAGSKVTLTLVREGMAEPFDLTLTREKVQVAGSVPPTSSSPAMTREGMVLVPAGTFWMGTTSHYDFLKNEQPRHKVTLNAFYLDKYPVTFDQYDKYCEANGKTKPKSNDWGRGQKPVVDITWDEANEYCKSQGKRLPTEAEWERAARAGADTVFPWGDDDNQGGPYGVYGLTFQQGPAPVGSKSPNAFGLYDMLGNTQVWVADWYSEDYFAKSPAKNPRGPEGGTQRTVRGSTFEGSGLDPAYRLGNDPDSRNWTIGCRCAESASARDRQADAAYQKQDEAALSRKNDAEKEKALADIDPTLKKAQAGDGKAQEEMGDFYSGMNGKGTNLIRDDKEAFGWYEKAAGQGSATAQYVLGEYCYLEGHGVEKDYGQALQWLRKSAAQGNFQAQTSIGWCYENGLGVAKDLEQAKHWYQLAAQQDWWQAKNALKNLGVSDTEGAGGTSGDGSSTPFASIPDRGNKNSGCNPGFPNGIQGTLTVNVHFNFSYNPKGDRIIEEEKGVKDLQDRLTGLATAHPGGPQFRFVDRSPCDLIVQFYLAGRSNTGRGDYTAYWGNVDTFSEHQSGYMFRLSTQAYEATDESDLFMPGWSEEIMEDATQKWYDFIANGWKCN